MSDSRKLQGYTDFILKVFHCLANQIYECIHIMLELTLTLFYEILV